MAAERTRLLYTVSSQAEMRRKARKAGKSSCSRHEMRQMGCKSCGIKFKVPVIPTVERRCVSAYRNKVPHNFRSTCNRERSDHCTVWTSESVLPLSQRDFFGVFILICSDKLIHADCWIVKSLVVPSTEDQVLDFIYVILHLVFDTRIGNNKVIDYFVSTCRRYVHSVTHWDHCLFRIVVDKGTLVVPPTSDIGYFVSVIITRSHNTCLTSVSLWKYENT